jgi:beta-glucosidase
MTLEEKLDMMIGRPSPHSVGESGYIPGVPRLGVPPLSLSNGPTGIENQFETTAIPTGINLAATFNPKLAYVFGQVSGQDLRASGSNVVLGPQVDIARTPNWGAMRRRWARILCWPPRWAPPRSRAFRTQAPWPPSSITSAITAA